jgi:hypothetical protein
MPDFGSQAASNVPGAKNHEPRRTRAGVNAIASQAGWIAMPGDRSPIPCRRSVTMTGTARVRSEI